MKMHDYNRAGVTSLHSSFRCSKVVTLGRAGLSAAGRRPSLPVTKQGEYGMRGMTLALGLAALLAAPAAAQTGSGTAIVDSLTACRTIAGAEARLACFDRAAAALDTAVKAKDVRIVSRQDVRKAKRSLFGFTLPKIDLFGGGRDEDDADEPAFTEINTTVASAKPGPNGRVEIRLADESEAVWTTTEPMKFPPRAGEKIRIRKGTLGNYFLNVGGRGYKGMRLR